MNPMNPMETRAAPLFSIPSPPIRHQQIIVTIFGLYSRADGGIMPVSLLISMLNELGYDAPGVRSSVSRLKARGVLQSAKSGSQAGYRLSSEILDTFEEGDKRIFSPSRTTPGDPWVLAIFSVPEKLRNLRHQLRSELAAMGFGSMSSGVWIAPAVVLEQTRRRLQARELDQFVDFFQGDYLMKGPMRPKVDQWWDLDVLDQQFADFLDLYGNAVDLWSGELGTDPVAALARSTESQRRHCFRYYVPMLTLWRRFPYQDPSLSLDYMPKGWKGPQARQTFVRTHELISPLAAEFARELADERVLAT
ncbi:PaaX family transcriptional regulator [Pseudarthrobacter sp. H2]|uniref:PaaX family transcriptional regulator n=1 Tax=Pseudarthrobacter sp. H2 TaxID=3418415 RepID=UPI003CF81983